MGRPPEEAEVRRMIRNAKNRRVYAPDREPLIALCDSWLAQGRVIDDLRTIAQAWISDKPNDWGGDVQGECGRVVFRYLAAVGETETP